VLGLAAVGLLNPGSARALDVVKPVCTVAGIINQLAGRACSLLGGGGGGISSTATTALTLAAVVAWVVGGASYVLHETSHVLGATTSPQLTSTWFSATYWRVAGIAALLTLPFLFAAAVQALVRSDLSLLVRSALGYLPLALIAVGLAAPVTMLLLAASDELSAMVSSAAGDRSARFLDHAIGLLGSVSAVIDAPFVVLMIALVTIAGALSLWIELLIREAAVYVIVLMLPLAFAAFVWPARRIWAIRAVELLIALILSKFAIVAVLALGGAALTQSATHSVTGLLAGGVLLALSAFAPWALFRLIPFTELASGATAAVRQSSHVVWERLARADVATTDAESWAATTAHMRRSARGAQGSEAESPLAEEGAAGAVEGLEAASDAPASGFGSPTDASSGPHPPPGRDDPPASGEEAVLLADQAGHSGAGAVGAADGAVGSAGGAVGSVSGAGGAAGGAGGSVSGAGGAAGGAGGAGGAVDYAGGPSDGDPAAAGAQAPLADATAAGATARPAGEPLPRLWRGQPVLDLEAICAAPAAGQEPPGHTADLPDPTPAEPADLSPPPSAAPAAPAPPPPAEPPARSPAPPPQEPR